MPTKRYVIRKVSGRYDYIDRWCVVAIRTDGSTRRVKHTTSDDKDSVIEDAWRRNEALAVLNATA
jgi:hypothetical protein